MTDVRPNSPKLGRDVSPPSVLKKDIPPTGYGEIFPVAPKLGSGKGGWVTWEKPLSSPQPSWGYNDDIGGGI